MTGPSTNISNERFIVEDPYNIVSYVLRSLFSDYRPWLCFENIILQTDSVLIYADLLNYRQQRLLLCAPSLIVPMSPMILTLLSWSPSSARIVLHTPGIVTAAKVETVERPIISAACSSEERAYFESRWLDYVVIGTSVVVLRRNHWACNYQVLLLADSQLRPNINRKLTTIEIHVAIKKLAAREQSIIVARCTLHNMSKGRDELVRGFMRWCPRTNMCVQIYDGVPRLWYLYELHWRKRTQKSNLSFSVTTLVERYFNS